MAVIRPINFLLAVGAICAVLLAMAPTPSSEASSSANATLSARLATTTAVSTSGCQSTTGASRFGAVQPNTPAVTGTDCTISFGASSRTSYLRLAQGDQSGNAMTRTPDGTLDPTWGGGDGMVGDDVSATDEEVAVGAFWDSSGRLVTVVRVIAAGGDDIVVSRFNSSGALDLSFAGGGRSIIDLGESEGLSGILVNEDGTFWAFGAKGVGAATDALVVKIDANGSLDPSFDGDGWKTFRQGNQESIGDLIAHPNGGFIANITRRSGFTYRSRLVRLTDELEPDTTWNAGLGEVVIPGENTTQCAGLRITNDGGVSCAGYRELDGSSTIGLVMKRLSDGRADPAFGGGDGIVEVEGPGSTSTNLSGAAQQADGTYLISGAITMTPINTSGYLTRLNPDGSVDATFDGDGSLAVELGNPFDTIAGIERLDDGGYWLLGTTTTVADKGRAVFGRLRSDLSLDTSFDGDGLMLVDIAATYTVAWITRFGGDAERVGVLGAASSGADGETSIAVFANDSTPDYELNSADWNEGDGTFGVCLRAVGGGATATWIPNATCPATDGAFWNGVPQQPATVAANSVLGANTGNVSLRFGFRPKEDQVPGQYRADLSFMVVAPEVDGTPPP